VFADREELAWLEGLLHPHVLAAQARWQAEQAALGSPPQVCAVEVPLLYETGGERRFDAVVVVTAPPDVRAGRARHADSTRREERLLDDEEKARRADFAYVNDGTLEELDAFVAGVVERLTSGSA
jgi:dephospho-CoA kinase